MKFFPQKGGKAYPIPCDEWDLLKIKIQKMSDRPWFFSTLGSLLLGAGASTFIAVLTGNFSSQAQKSALIAAWYVVAVTLFCGAICLVFAEQQKRVERVQIADVLTHMELVEKRYDIGAA